MARSVRRTWSFGRAGRLRRWLRLACVAAYEDYDLRPPRGWSPGAVSLVATLVLLLGLGGAVAGIHFGNKVNANRAGGEPITLPQVVSSLTPGPQRTTAPPTTAPGSFELPDVTGSDFQAARSQLRVLKLGVTLVFEGSTGNHTVRTTQPAPRTVVKNGVTVKLFVRGPAPEATVPGVVGIPCDQAADIIVEQGLFPQYPTGKQGVVLNQDPPAPPATPLHWNDTVRIFCGTASPSPSP